jgi:hypothetical protein
MTTALALWLRLHWWQARRVLLCPYDRHLWQYFGNRSRVCRCCRVEQWYDPGRGWTVEKHQFAETAPSPHELP